MDCELLYLHTYIQYNIHLVHKIHQTQGGYTLCNTSNYATVIKLCTVYIVHHMDMTCEKQKL